MNIGALVGLDFNVPLWLILILLLALTYYIYMTWNHNLLKELGIPGPKPTPIIGTLGKLFKEGVIEHDLALIKEYGPVCGGYAGRTPFILTTDLDIVREILVKEFPKFTERNIKISQPGLGSKMLTALRGERWKHVRNSLSPTFSAGKLKLMSKQININAESLVKHIQQHVDEDKMFEFKEFSGAYTMDVIAGTAFGIQLDSQVDKESQFVAMAKEAFQFSFKNPALIVLVLLPHAMKLVSKLGIGFMRKNMEDFFKGVVQSVLKQHEKQQKAENFIQLVANALVKKPTKEDVGKPTVFKDEDGDLWTTDGLTEEEILANAIIFFLAGYETTANTINFAAYFLATNPEIQERLIEEIDTHLHGKEPRYEDLTDMQYLDNVISETLRLYPQAPRLTRHVGEDIVIKGVKLPKGVDVGICAWHIHRDPQYWPDPETFNPDRFNPDEKATRSPYCYMPFGHGPRNCIGMRLALMEMKFCFIRILQKFRLVPTEKTPIPMKLDKMRMIPENGNWLKATARTDVDS